MNRNVYVYGGLFALLLAGAWWRWSNPDDAKEKSGKEIVVLDARASEVTRIVWHDEKGDTTVDVLTDELGSYPWVTLVERKKKPARDDAASAPEKQDLSSEGAATAEAHEYEETRSNFRGGESATKLLDAFQPLKAKRKLEKVAPEKLADLGLEKPENWLEVTRKGQARRFEVGGETYGAKDRYVKDTSSGKVYLIAADTLRPLLFAKSRLPDRALSSVQTDKLTKVRLGGPTGSVEMVQRNREDKDKAYWAASSVPDEAVPMYATWLDKVLKMKSISNVQEADVPKDLVPSFQLTLFPEGGKPETIEVLSAVGERGESDYYARGNYLRGLVKLQRSATSDAAADVPSVISARPGEDLVEEEKEKERDKDRAAEKDPSSMPPRAPGMPPRPPMLPKAPRTNP
jgi:hypothetical protein